MSRVVTNILYRIGPNRWRDIMTPVDILNNHARFHGKSSPTWEGSTTVTYDNYEYTLEQFGKK